MKCIKAIAIDVCPMLTTFMKEIITFSFLQTPNTFENRNVTRYNLRIFTRIFSA